MTRRCKTLTVAGFALLGAWLILGAGSAAAQNGRKGQLHIVKDCSTFSGIPGSSYCTVVTSTHADLPTGTRIYYDQITAGPTAGPGYLDSNIFVYVSDNQWAVGRCTVSNANGPGVLGVCTISDGMGPLAGFTARVNVTYQPGGSGAVYGWDGTYSFNPLPDR